MGNNDVFIRNICLKPVSFSTLTLCLSLFLLGVCDTATKPTVKNIVVAEPSLAEQRLSWQKKLNWSDLRCPKTLPFEHDSGIEQHTLKKDLSLVVVVCSLGAYQGDSLLYQLDAEKKAQPLQFLQFQSLDKGQLQPYTDTLLTGIIEVDSNKHLIIVWRKYRGIGDCGQLLHYHLRKGQTTLVKLQKKD